LSGHDIVLAVSCSLCCTQCSDNALCAWAASGRGRELKWIEYLAVDEELSNGGCCIVTESGDDDADVDVQLGGGVEAVTRHRQRGSAAASSHT